MKVAESRASRANERAVFPRADIPPRVTERLFIMLYIDNRRQRRRSRGFHSYCVLRRDCGGATQLLPTTIGVIANKAALFRNRRIQRKTLVFFQRRLR
jgi:hypothetical protein